MAKHRDVSFYRNLILHCLDYAPFLPKKDYHLPEMRRLRTVRNAVNALREDYYAWFFDHISHLPPEDWTPERLLRHVRCVSLDDAREEFLLSCSLVVQFVHFVVAKHECFGYIEAAAVCLNEIFLAKYRAKFDDGREGGFERFCDAVRRGSLRRAETRGRDVASFWSRRDFEKLKLDSKRIEAQCSELEVPFYVFEYRRYFCPFAEKSETQKLEAKETTSDDAPQSGSNDEVKKNLNCSKETSDVSEINCPKETGRFCLGHALTVSYLKLKSEEAMIISKWEKDSNISNAESSGEQNMTNRILWPGDKIRNGDSVKVEVDKTGDEPLNNDKKEESLKLEISEMSDEDLNKLGKNGDLPEVDDKDLIKQIENEESVESEISKVSDEDLKLGKNGDFPNVDDKDIIKQIEYEESLESENRKMSDEDLNKVGKNGDFPKVDDKDLFKQIGNEELVESEISKVSDEDNLGKNGDSPKKDDNYVIRLFKIGELIQVEIVEMSLNDSGKSGESLKVEVGKATDEDVIKLDDNRGSSLGEIGKMNDEDSTNTSFLKDFGHQNPKKKLDTRADLPSSVILKSIFGLGMIALRKRLSSWLTVLKKALKSPLMKMLCYVLNVFRIPFEKGDKVLQPTNLVTSEHGLIKDDDSAEGKEQTLWEDSLKVESNSPPLEPASREENPSNLNLVSEEHPLALGEDSLKVKLNPPTSEPASRERTSGLKGQESASNTNPVSEDRPVALGDGSLKGAENGINLDPVSRECTSKSKGESLEVKENPSNSSIEQNALGGDSAKSMKCPFLATLLARKKTNPSKTIPPVEEESCSVSLESVQTALDWIRGTRLLKRIFRYHGTKFFPGEKCPFCHTECYKNFYDCLSKYREHFVGVPSERNIAMFRGRETLAD